MNNRPHAVRKRVILALATLPFLGVVAAFGIAPDTSIDDMELATVVETVVPPEIQATDSGVFDFWREERISRGDTLPGLLTRMDVDADDIQGVMAAARQNSALGRLAPGRTVLTRVTSGGSLMLLRYMASDDTLVSVERVGDGFRVVEQAIQPEMRPIMRSGTIQGSLFGATDAADVPDRIASAMAEAFSGEIDFHRDLRRGDQFSVVYEAFYVDGRLVRTGRLLAAEFINQGKTYQAIYFQDPQGREGYYTADGQSLKRAFLKSPMPFDRVSSGFTMRRFHPVLQTWRSHKGIDYAAPTGTPVRAVADGAVTFVGTQGGYGNLVVLTHQRPYSTAYAHLSRFGSGIRNGARVSQGQIIGYVGCTGLCTGPHLHYEFRVNGEQRDPLAMKLPTSLPLDARYKAAFAAQAQPMVSRLELLRGTNLARMD